MNTVGKRSLSRAVERAKVWVRHFLQGLRIHRRGQVGQAIHRSWNKAALRINCDYNLPTSKARYQRRLRIAAEFVFEQEELEQQARQRHRYILLNKLGILNPTMMQENCWQEAKVVLTLPEHEIHAIKNCAAYGNDIAPVYRSLLGPTPAAKK